MKIEKVREVLRAQPFQPFWIYLADGGKIPVEHEDFVALGPTGREMIVFLADNTHHIIDVPLVTRLQVKPRSEVHKKKR